MRWIILTTLLSFAALANAQIRLPLEGYYRIGKCMPIVVDASNSPLHLSADHAVETDVAAGRGGVVPMLMLGKSESLHAGNREIPLHPLSSDQRLIATTGDDTPLPSQLFPNQTFVIVHLDPAHPLAGPGVAWESLDAVILERTIDSPKLAELLAGGTIVMVREKNRPDSHWPWKRIGTFWMLQANPAGPADAIGGDDAYLPMQSWRAQQPPALRWQVVVVGAVVCLVMISPLLMRGPAAIVAMLSIALICGGAIEVWRREQSPLQTAWGKIIVDSHELQQTDTWRYFTSLHGGRGEEPADSRPIVLDAEHAVQIKLRLQCGPGGIDAWHFRLPAEAQIAFLSRTYSPRSALPAINPTSHSPLYELGRQMYLDPDTKILGEISAGDRWPTVVIDGQ